MYRHEFSQEQNGQIISQKKTSSTSFDLKNWIVDLDTNTINEYGSERIPNNEIIKGKKGKYYWIDLKDVDTEEIILFESGKYTIDSFDRRFGKSLNIFYRDFFEALKSHPKKLDIYLQGKADITGDKTFEQKIIDNNYCDSEDFLSIQAHPEVDSFLQRYSIDTVDKSIQTKEFKNADLPNLRARFIQCKLQETYDLLKSDYKPEILDGKVESKIGEKYRNGSLILFIDADFE